MKPKTSIATQSLAMMAITQHSVKTGSKAGLPARELASLIDRSVATAGNAARDLISQKYPIFNSRRLGGYVLMRNDKATRMEALHAHQLRQAELQTRAANNNILGVTMGEKMSIPTTQVQVTEIDSTLAIESGK